MATLSYEQLGRVRGLIDTLNDQNDSDFMVGYAEVTTYKGDEVGRVEFDTKTDDYFFVPYEKEA